MKENVRTGLYAMWACWAERVEVRVESCSEFSSWGVICQCAGHTTKHADIIVGYVKEEVCRRFVADGRFKNLLLMADGKPLSSFET